MHRINMLLTFRFKTFTIFSRQNMCEPRCKVCWVNNTNKEISDLQTISKDARTQLEESINAVLAVKTSVEDVLSRCHILQKYEEEKPTFLKQQTSEEKKINQEPSQKHFVDENSKDTVFFVFVSTGLTNEGMFWCRYWNSDTPFHDSRLHQISKQLESIQKDKSVETAEKQVSKKMVFCYSEKHSLYLRTIIQRCVPTGVEVIYVDLGITRIVEDDVTFYVLDEDHIKNNPFLSAYCSLYFEEEKVIPRVAKWCFRDMTENKVLLARVVKVTDEDTLPCHHVELKTMLGETEFVNDEVSKRISEYEENEKRKAEERAKYEKACKKTEEEDNDQPSTDTAKEDTEESNQKEILKEYLLSKKKTRPRRYSEQIHEKSFDFGIADNAMQHSRSLSNLFNIDPDMIGEMKPVKWWEEFPDEQRRLVPSHLPPLRNLFYAKFDIKKESWDEIELMNINQLLKSESNMIFYAFEFHPNFIEKSFINKFFFFGKNDFPKAVSNINENLGVVTQYIFLIQRGTEPEMYQLYGLARIETLKSDTQGTQMYISYYSLCDVGSCKIVCSSKIPNSVDLKPAKELVQRMKMYIENGLANPMYEKYYPYCGVPPLIKFEKPKYPTFARAQNKAKQNKEERKVMKDEFRDNKDRKNERRNSNSNNNRNNNRNKKKDNYKRKGRMSSADNWRSNNETDYEKDNFEVNGGEKQHSDKGIIRKFKDAIDDRAEKQANGYHSDEKGYKDKKKTQRKTNDEKRNSFIGDDPAILGYKMQDE